MNHVIPKGNSCHALDLRLQRMYLVYILSIARAFLEGLLALMVSTLVKVVAVYPRGSMNMVKTSGKPTHLMLCLYT